MAWRAVTEQDLLKHLSYDEMSRIRAAAVGDSGDPIADTLAGITATIRGYISAHPANRLGPHGTLPEELIDCACHMAVPHAWTRVGGGMVDPKGLRKAAADEATRMLREDVARGFFRVAPPPLADQQAPGAGGADCELASGDSNYPKSTELNGLF